MAWEKRESVHTALDHPPRPSADLGIQRVFPVTGVPGAQFSVGWCPMDARDSPQPFPTTFVYRPISGCRVCFAASKLATLAI